MEIADSLFQAKQSVRVFVKLYEGDSIVEVKDTTQWPGGINVVYNLCYDEQRKIVLVKEVPIFESGDIYAVYTYYFRLDTVYAAKTRVSFFNGDCSNSAITEVRVFYGLNGTGQRSTYSLKDAEGTLLDSLRCSFGELVRFSNYRRLSELPEGVVPVPDRSP